MKKIIYLLIVCISNILQAQVEVIIEDETKSAYEGNSYLVTGKLKFTEGFSYNSASDEGSFYARVFDEELTYIPDLAFYGRIVGRFPEARVYYPQNTILKHYVLTEEISQVTELYFPKVNSYEDEITDITGIEDFASLQSFNFFRHDIASADLSQNSVLQEVNFPENLNLLCLKVSQNQLDDPSTSSWNIPSFTSLSINTCNELPRTTIPDWQFEQKLIDMGYDNARDQGVNTDKISGIENLTIIDIYYNVTDISGIEDFAALTEFKYTTINYGGLSVVPDFSQNDNLIKISMGSQLNIECIKVSESQLDHQSNWNINSYIGITTGGECEVIDIDGTEWEAALYENGYLWSPYYDNKISDVLAESISELDFSNQQLKDFNGMEIFTNLKNLNASLNYFNDDDLSSLELLNHLENLNLSNNYLRNPNVSMLSALRSLDIRNNNNLTCVQVSQDQMANHVQNWQKDTDVEWSLDCSSPPMATSVAEKTTEIVLSTDESLRYTLYPNPANDFIELLGDINYASVIIYDLKGNEIVNYQNGNTNAMTIDATSIVDGIYLIRIKAKSGELIERKLVIKH